MTDTKTEIKRLEAEERAQFKALKELAFVTKDTDGYISFTITNGIDYDQDCEIWSKEQEAYLEGRRAPEVEVVIKLIGDMGNTHLSSDDLDAIAAKRYKAYSISRKVKRIRKDLTKQRDILRKERELERAKNRSEQCLEIELDGKSDF